MLRTLTKSVTTHTAHASAQYIRLKLAPSTPGSASKCMAHRGAKHLAAGCENKLFTTTIPEARIAAWEAEVERLKPRKQKNWSGTLQDRFGVLTRVRYNPEGVVIPGSSYVSHFENFLSGRRQGIRGTDSEWIPVVPAGLMASIAEKMPGMALIRPYGDDRLDHMSDAESGVQHHHQRMENHTSNHLI